MHRLISVIEFGDKILFDFDDCKKDTGYKDLEEINKGLVGLLNAEMIARTKNSNFYLLILIFFYKGDRMVLVTEYREKREKYAIYPNQDALLDKRQN